jgi:hypothetical protein
MDAYRVRMTAEKSELDAKIIKLTDFIGSGIYHTLEHHDQYLLRRQLLVMNEYSDILNQRLERSWIKHE